MHVHYLRPNFRQRLSSVAWTMSNAAFDGADYHHVSSFSCVCTHDKKNSTELKASLKEKGQSIYRLKLKQSKKIIMAHCVSVFPYAHVCCCTPTSFLPNDMRMLFGKQLWPEGFPRGGICRAEDNHNSTSLSAGSSVQINSNGSLTDQQSLWDDRHSKQVSRVATESGR